MNDDENLKAELAKAVAECEQLRVENARLRLRVGEAPDIRDSREQPPSIAEEKSQSPAPVTVDSRPEVKVSLFKDLFRGRDDVYAVRWEGKNGRSGYSPAGAKEWDQSPSSGRALKKSFRITKLFSLSEEVIRDHLLGKQTIGVYPERSLNEIVRRHESLRTTFTSIDGRPMQGPVSCKRRPHISPET